MVSMDRAKAVDRVRKFLAIADRPTTHPHEVVAMRRQAQRLIAEHDIGLDEVTPPPRAPRPARARSPWEGLLVAFVDLLDEQEARKNSRRRRR